MSSFNIQVDGYTAAASSINNHVCGSWCNHWQTVDYSWYTYPTIKYMYQLTCPKDKSKNWCELEQTVICKKCGSTLKAVLKKVEYEIEVGE